MKAEVTVFLNNIKTQEFISELRNLFQLQSLVLTCDVTYNKT